MRLRISLGAVLLLASLAGSALADHRGPCAVNGCGPGSWRLRIVPDRFLGCEFKTACDSHDRCYGQCMACGPRHDDNVCRPPGRPALRDQCDTQLEADIDAANNNHWFCNGFGWLFWLGCHQLGEPYFGATNALRMARALPSEEAIATVKADIEAILDYTDYRQDNPQAAENLRNIKDAVKVLARADTRLENRFVVKTLAGKKTLAFEAKRPPAQTTIESKDRRQFVQRSLLGEIDVTNMRVNQRPVDLEAVIRTTPGIDPRNLDRTLKLEPVR
jgi:hypothetical protein